ncbi:MAG TPA: bifunctional diaminohydroxyphosphoribosylaminopyrimidine deaminase/5-amino-6-(5-phosphoribosylamino)uracil reductase RibD [Candidatus Avacidaminococcus intestinavium]|uniref:Riboflavin biosynthesis protein RibD n=1 Tax=Candidatus Avacidaminococcus intestinavium TaxID=2840684 RepID=A0A9D1MPQ0_9FIRM|nr:bifunctional diaminohydroxyphosphoribosylaminopyrimidine deaminase/5-amino-6-(5-phosphoribosylamino)uracil reductase RibD [Candidatus Avacidaminococcus intestinavium]
MQDEDWMKRALTLAERAKGQTSPNPLVGAVIVDSDGNLISEGYHHRAGEDHAEVVALKTAGTRARGATLYVTLEPCSHYGRTPPCAKAIVKAGIKRVVVATLDPNPLVSGKGVAILTAANISVTLNVLQEEATKLNEVFFHWITQQRPFIALKYAMTLDGKIATASGDSKWITGEQARAYGHYLRSIYDAILVGKGTVLADDPSLTVRLIKGRNPIRIVLDTHLSIPLTATLLNDGLAPTWIVCSANAALEKMSCLQKKVGVEVITVPLTNGQLSIAALMKELAKRNVTSVLVEGGSLVHGSFCDAALVEKVYAFIAPKIIGGLNAKTAIGGTGCATIQAGLTFKELTQEKLGCDYLFTGRVER